ncbi:hypothetical protein M8J77_005384 [Diaphorina citri]|nr:hypothetical protein M8J77_005384 [Diaphorina citri]
MCRNACAQTNEAGVMNYDVIAYGSVCRDVKLHDLPVMIITDGTPRVKKSDELEPSIDMMKLSQRCDDETVALSDLIKQSIDLGLNA